MKLLSLVLLSLLTFNQILAANEYFPVGARLIGLGNASVAMTDTWSGFSNIAGIAHIRNQQVGVFFQQKYRFSDFNLQAAVFNSPLPRMSKGEMGNLGLGIFRFGNDLYSEYKASIGWANKIRFVSMGFQIDYLQTTVQSLGSKSNFAINFGGQVELSKNFTFGACIFNINQAQITENQNDKIPTVMKAGLSYHFEQKIWVNFEVDKEVERNTNYKMGIEYAIIDKIRCRTGINVMPESYFFGLGWHNKFLEFNYGLSMHPNLGDSHALSINFSFANKKSITPNER